MTQARKFAPMREKDTVCSPPVSDGASGDVKQFGQGNTEDILGISRFGELGFWPFGVHRKGARRIIMVDKLDDENLGKVMRTACC